MIKLIVDSTFGIPEDYAIKNDIKVVNLKLILGDETFDEGYEKDWGVFYEKMRVSKINPTTSQPSPQDFMNAIDSIFEKDENAEIVILTISNRLSGTINSATIAANSYENKRITAIDSKQATTCGRLMVEEVIEHINNGENYEQILNLIENLSAKLKIQFVPDTMDALKRGGRVNALAATLASILKIKPVFCFADGKINVLKKVLGLNAAISAMIANIPKQLKKIYICYIHDKINVQKIMDKVKEVICGKNIEAVAIEPVFGVHVGIGSVGIATLEN